MAARPLTPEILWRIRRAGGPVPAPDGSFVIVPVTEHPEDDAVTMLYLVADGAVRPLTTAERSSSQPAISPDGATVAFTRKREGGEHPELAVMPIAGGEARIVTDLPLAVTRPRWTGDGKAVLFTAEVLKEAPDLDGTRRLLEEREDRKASGKATEDRLYRYFDRWMSDGSVHHVMRYDLTTGEVTDLMPGWTHWVDPDDPGSAWDVSPDGRHVVFSADVSDPPHHVIQFAIHEVPTDGSGEVRRLGELTGHTWRPRWSPDGGSIVYGRQRDLDFYGDPHKLVRYDWASGAETELTAEWDRSAAEWEFAPDGAHLVLAGVDDGRTHLYRTAPEPGVPERLASGGWVRGPRPADDGNVYFSLDSLRAPADVWRVPLEGGDPEQLTRLNDDVLAEVDLGDVAEVEFAGANDDPIQAFVVYPPDHDPSRPAPLVQNIHGGPHGVYGDTWFYRWNAQTFAAAGYVIAMVNFHGSSGLGRDFAASILGAWGDMPATDVEAGTDHLIQEGIADPDRMAVIGGSYGGYLVAWLIGHTDRYAAAICHAGVVNLLGQYATDTTYGRDRSMGAQAWEDIDQVLRWSPTAQIQDLTTPTLVVHGERDYRVVVDQGLELYGILKAKGVDARLLYYPDEGHWILKKPNSLQWYDEVLGWLERYLG